MVGLHGPPSTPCQGRPILVEHLLCISLAAPFSCFFSVQDLFRLGWFSTRLWFGYAHPTHGCVISSPCCPTTPLPVLPTNFAMFRCQSPTTIRAVQVDSVSSYLPFCDDGFQPATLLIFPYLRHSRLVLGPHATTPRTRGQRGVFPVPATRRLHTLHTHPHFYPPPATRLAHILLRSLDRTLDYQRPCDIDVHSATVNRPYLQRHTTPRVRFVTCTVDSSFHWRTPCATRPFNILPCYLFWTAAIPCQRGGRLDTKHAGPLPHPLPRRVVWTLPYYLPAVVRAVGLVLRPALDIPGPTHPLTFCPHTACRSRHLAFTGFTPPPTHGLCSVPFRYPYSVLAGAFIPPPAMHPVPHLPHHLYRSSNRRDTKATTTVYLPAVLYLRSAFARVLQHALYTLRTHCHTVTLPSPSLF